MTVDDAKLQGLMGRVVGDWAAAFAELLPSRPFSEAKAKLSDVMTDVVHRHHPQVVDRRGGKERMILMAVGDLADVLESFTFGPRSASPTASSSCGCPNWG
jgi:hypothetical protein